MSLRNTTAIVNIHYTRKNFLFTIFMKGAAIFMKCHVNRRITAVRITPLYYCLSFWKPLRQIIDKRIFFALYFSVFPYFPFYFCLPP